MAERVRLQAWVDKEQNRVIFIESDEDFVDVLFSFLTMPMGRIVGLTRDQPPITRIGCLNNIYESVENLDVKRLRTDACKTMLLHPQNGAATWCESLKLKIDNCKPPRYFICNNCKSLSLSNNASCCGQPIHCEATHWIRKKVASDGRDQGVFVKGLTRFVISDALHVKPSSTTASLHFLSKLGITDVSAIEERTFDVGVNEVLNLLNFSLVSKTPLTKTLLKNEAASEFSQEGFDQSSSIKQKIDEHASQENGKICVKLILSKSMKTICYAEVGEDFVDLLFSFLTIPLGYIVKEMNGGPSKGCTNNLYESVENLDAEKYFESNDHKNSLLCPKVAPGFGYGNQRLEVEEAAQQSYYLQQQSSYRSDFTLIKDITLASPYDTLLTVVDPKSGGKEDTSVIGAFVTRPAMFTVTDDLIITPISQASCLSILKKLKVLVNDVEERVVNVGNEEASRLLIASFVSECALTDVFILTKPKQ